MDFPVKPVVALKTDTKPLSEALGVKVIFVGEAWFDYLALVENEADIKTMQPDFGALKKIPARGIIVTAQSQHKGYDFVSRFFAPSVGIDEDPVTGSAHCALAAYWSKELHKTEMTGFQASKEGGMVGMSFRGDRVTLSGKVKEITVFDKVSVEPG
jgi:PhzF family phenazine biosynthesis protein